MLREEKQGLWYRQEEEEQEGRAEIIPTYSPPQAGDGDSEDTQEVYPDSSGQPGGGNFTPEEVYFSSLQFQDKPDSASPQSDVENCVVETEALMEDTEEVDTVKDELTSPVSVNEKRNMKKEDREEILRTAKMLKAC